ncbi:Glycosyltransferase, catalytic subunit of cellulose synthase and poly-beta-1,6-N-acetylglucosamine synthase [Chitinophaga jiangningensis]|uniref:Glycosyltransferase, catalytic subunit of cellulose synthase and poly-beta-1,6-N-acetylglucosamine synthase n=1 Tax=Chitinophaga jiangningensis TaxID=1419482 RepID=A0A1M7BQM5_9BACT|nr:glycosyltransferase [Chitinophaga jiangningensis]SHL57281.1 Glycosyltransferase, catalytic subunit of cellulose synthase and poly-beta-1,6-N-acetylglucosamine synthase [Chitinophaga jiangningensis]
MSSVQEILAAFYDSSIFVYGLTLIIVYGLLALLSIIAIRRYLNATKPSQLENLVSSPLAPGISILAPAYNEGLTIIANVRSLLTLNYPKFEIVLINDGSTDDSLEQLIREFDMVAVDFAYNEKIRTKPVKNIYKSRNLAYSNLLVIDKANGKSKADAVNAGINAAAFDYFVCTDVDCVLHKDTLLELIKPVMQDGDKRVIAIGATLRIANSSEFDEGVMTRMRPPKAMLPRFQEVEYIRSFVLGKMGWSALNCVPNVSGGLGLFDREIVIKSGGYDHKSFGEDMELLTRMCRFCEDNKIKYAVRYIPKTLCWTEGPASLQVFGRQRTRWARGLAQLMFAHRGVFLNPRYGRLGLVVFPYNFFFELLAPLVEASGVIVYLWLAFTDNVNWPYAILLLIFVYTYAIMITTLSILWDQLSFHYYKSFKEVLSLCIMPFLEFLLYHPLITFYSLKGYFFFLTNRRSSWGNMQRQGFKKAKTTT